MQTLKYTSMEKNVEFLTQDVFYVQGFKPSPFESLKLGPYIYGGGLGVMANPS